MRQRILGSHTPPHDRRTVGRGGGGGGGPLTRPWLRAARGTAAAPHGLGPMPSRNCPTRGAPCHRRGTAPPTSSQGALLGCRHIGTLLPHGGSGTRAHPEGKPAGAESPAITTSVRCGRSRQGVRGSVWRAGADPPAGLGAGISQRGLGPAVAPSCRTSHPQYSPVRRNSLSARPMDNASPGLGVEVGRRGRWLAVTFEGTSHRPCFPVRRYTPPIRPMDNASPSGGEGGVPRHHPGHSPCERQRCGGSASCHTATDPLRRGAPCHRAGWFPPPEGTWAITSSQGACMGCGRIDSLLPGEESGPWGRPKSGVARAGVAAITAATSTGRDP